MKAKEESKPLPFDWGALVSREMHPMRVAIIETLTWIGQPLSATDLGKVFEGKFLVTNISQHLIGLAKGGVLVIASQRPVRGATEKFYFFPEDPFQGQMGGTGLEPVTPSL